MADFSFERLKTDLLRNPVLFVKFQQLKTSTE